MREGRAEAGVEPRWPLVGPVGPDGPQNLRGTLLAVLALLTAALAPFDLWLRATLVSAVAAALLLYRILRRRGEPAPRGWVALDQAGVTRVDEAGTTALARWAEPFGVTVLANQARTRAVLAFTTPEQTRHVAVHLAGAEDAGTAPSLRARAVTVTDGDLPGDGRAALRAEEAAALVRAVALRSPGALERIYLSDPNGGRISLEGTVLRVGERVFDLDAALEWRGVMFHESGAHVATIYQGTWIRQGASEVVLVAPMPAELSSWALGQGARGAALAREQRLMQALPDVPPPRELRVAIERLFMMPLRQALDRAPRASHAGGPSATGPHAVQT